MTRLAGALGTEDKSGDQSSSPVGWVHLQRRLVVRGGEVDEHLNWESVAVVSTNQTSKMAEEQGAMETA